jgi:hypothetical protein
MMVWELLNESGPGDGSGRYHRPDDISTYVNVKTCLSDSYLPVGRRGCNLEGSQTRLSSSAISIFHLDQQRMPPFAEVSDFGEGLGHILSAR